METEFHYWITGIVAQHAGFDPSAAAVIAYAAQHVDDNTRRLSINDPEGREKPYQAFISQTMDITKPRTDLMHIYPVFHFLPGDPLAESARRRDGKMHVLMTTPDSPLANKALQDALASKDLYRIGVAAHAFADTWAHQNFVGWHSSLNGRGSNPLAIGHLEFMHLPDWVGHAWEDSRLVNPHVDNNVRFLTAAQRLCEEFAKALGSGAQWSGLEGPLQQAMGPSYSSLSSQGGNTRMKAYRALGEDWLPNYNSAAWFEAAVNSRYVLANGQTVADPYTVEVCNWKPGWQISHWLRFQEAIKAHQEFCLAELEGVFRQMDVDIRAH